jgi:hypothetical protein
MKVTKISQLSRKESTMELDITPEQLYRVENRFSTKELIQNIVPHLSMNEREFLMTGITGEEWNNMFGEIEE